MQGPTDEREVRLCFSNDESVNVSRVFASPAEKISQLQAMNPVLFDFYFPDDVG